MVWVTPLPTMKLLGTTSDSESFRAINVDKEVELPIGGHCGAFGTKRRYHSHEGVDLYAAEGTPVAAVETGIVVDIEDFTGEKAGSPWWQNTQALHVESDQHVVVYGEVIVKDSLSIGHVVNQGDIVGHTKTVLTKDKGRPMCMLHFELHARGKRSPSPEWSPPELPKPEALLDPTPLLTPLFQGA